MARLNVQLLPPLSQTPLLTGVTVRRNISQSAAPAPVAAPLPSSGKQWPR